MLNLRKHCDNSYYVLQEKLSKEGDRDHNVRFVYKITEFPEVPLLQLHHNNATQTVHCLRAVP